MPDQRHGNDDDNDLGIDWLAAQLNADGSEKDDAESEPDAEPETAAEPEPEPAAAARPDSAPTVALPVTPDPAVPPARTAPAVPRSVPAPAADAPATPAERAATERPDTASATERSDAKTSAPDPVEGDTAPSQPVSAEPAAGGFRWGLTPTIEPDPAVDAAQRTPPAKAAAPAPAVPASAPPVAPARAAAAPPAPTPAAAPPAPTPAAAPPAPAAAPPAAAPPAAPARTPAPVSAASAAVEHDEPLTKTPAPPRRSTADLEAAPWWTTPAKSRLEPTEEEQAAALGRRTPATPPSPLGTGVSPRVAATPAPTPTPPAAAPLAAPRAAHSASPLPEEAPAALPVSAATAAAATGAAQSVPSQAASAAAPAPADDLPDGPRRRGPGGGVPPRRPVNRTLLWVGGGVLAVLVIIGLFFLGQSLGDTPAAAPTESASEAPSDGAAPTPTEVPEATAPQPAGVHAWNTMFGTECLDPFTSPWDEEFTVVDCAAPHAAQLVYRGVLEGEQGAPFPGEQAFADQINVLCSAPGVINYEAAGGYADVQLQGSYPVTAEQWDAGDRYFYCFATRSSGEPLTSSLAPVA